MITVPLMPNYGYPPPARGALEVQLLRVEGLVDSSKMVYVTMEVGEGGGRGDQRLGFSHGPEAGVSHGPRDWGLVVGHSPH